MKSNFWNVFWRCVECKFTMPFNQARQSDIDCTNPNDTWMKCKKCKNEMKRTVMEKIK